MPVIIWDIDGTLFDTHLQLDIKPDDVFGLDDITLFPDAHAALSMQGVIHIMISYAKHSVAMQHKKLAVLGVRDFFDEIHIIPKDGNKLAVMKDIKKRFSGPFFVVGDKVSDEIEYGNKLGMTTILCPRGKHMFLKPQNTFQEPDYTIKDLTALSGIIKS